MVQSRGFRGTQGNSGELKGTQGSLGLNGYGEEKSEENSEEKSEEKSEDFS